VTTITPPTLEMKTTLCTCCQLPVTHTGRWVWLAGFGGKAANLCPDCAQLSPTDRAIKRMQTKQAANRAKRTAVITELIPYAEYLATPHWQATRRAALDYHGRWCRLCDAQGNGVKWNIHHRHYNSLGHEAMEDLTVLCEDCHHLYEDAKRGAL